MPTGDDCLGKTGMGGKPDEELLEGREELPYGTGFVALP